MAAGRIPRLPASCTTRTSMSERRDAGVPREAASATPGPTTDSAFGRAREAAIAEVMAESPRKRARRMVEAPPGLARIAREIAEDIGQRPTVASAAVVEKVAKRVEPIRERDLRGAVAAAKGRAKREGTVIQSHAQERRGCISQSESSLRPGLHACAPQRAECSTQCAEARIPCSE